MKNVVRILSLTVALAFAAIPATPLEPLSTCRYRCCTFNPVQCQSYSYLSTWSQCCGSSGMLCPPGAAQLGLSWGDPAQKCAV